jgi:ABC-type antimicrobial peptide transport system permease subunit
VGLSAIGLYALLAYGVTRRTPEIGIRMALGAERADVRWMIVRQSLVLAAWGLAIGAAAAVAGTRLVEALLFEVQARDPFAIGAAAALMLAVCIAAGHLPARRAARVSPVVSLKGL